jgi:hypothetical protein
MPIPLASFFAAPIFFKIIGWIITYTAVRIFVSLGFFLITFTGLNLVWEGFENRIAIALSAVPASVYDLLALGGFIDAINIMLAAVSSVLLVKTTLGYRKAVFK